MVQSNSLATNGTPPPPLLSGKDQNQGRRSNMEDRLRVDTIQTAGRLTLMVAMVADGIGGAAFGERAAELAIETAFSVIEESPTADAKHIPFLLQHALEQAQKVILAEQNAERSKRDMGTTAVLAAVTNNTLYLANIGDSRAYLVRGNKLHQLTRDHSWSREMLRLGLLHDPEEAARHPKADELYRSLGSEDNFEIDLGIYLNGSAADGEGMQGLPLQANDRLLLCSDGLVRTRHTGSGQYVEDAEIVHALTHFAPEKAAVELVRRATSRRADDNVSVIVLEMPGSTRAFALPPWTRYVVAGAGALGLLTLILFLIFNNASGEPEIATVEPFPTRAIEATIAPPAELPAEDVDTGTAVRLVQNGVETDTGWTLLDDGTLVLIPNGSEGIQLRYPDGSELFLAPSTEVALAMSGAERRVEISQGTIVFSNSGATTLIHSRNNSWVRVSGPEALVGVTSVLEPTIEFLVHCLGGAGCELKGDLAETVLTLRAGEAGRVGGNGQPVASGPADYSVFAALAALVPTPTNTTTAEPTAEPTATLEPTATPTRGPIGVVPTSVLVTPTAVPPTDTPQPTIEPEDEDQPTRPPRPEPTATPPSLPTNTPRPPTDTPRPPTDTPRPPTDTPRPPTNTPRPPTNTPRPPTDTPPTDTPPTDTPPTDTPPTDTPPTDTPPTDTPPTDTPPTDTPEPES